MLGEQGKATTMVELKMLVWLLRVKEQDIDEEGLELKEAKELEQNQMQALHDEDFAVSEDEEEEREREEDANLNLGVGN